MEENSKVFSANIKRKARPLENNLHELIDVLPAKPAFVRGRNDYECTGTEIFEPKTGKVYVPKRRTKQSIKVRTVRDIRKLFESDIFPDLVKDLKKQQNYLSRKIASSHKGEKTKSLAISMLNSEKPISRSCWEMLTNINPHGQSHTIQYVLWDGRRIRINGSRGGKSKFLCKYDLQKSGKVQRNENKTTFSQKSGIQRNSLSIRFRPGPLGKKKLLEGFYQKDNIGNIEVVNLPKPGLDIQAKYGVPLTPEIANFVHSLREVNGVITEKWAEFSVSVLGDIKNKKPVQNTNNPTISFDLSYKNYQHRMLMGCNVNSLRLDDILKCNILGSQRHSDKEINSEVGLLLKKLNESVEISLQQDYVYTGADEARERAPNESTGEVQTATKFYNKTCLENDKRALSVVAEKLNLHNVEPWCMIHRLYKCFCRGKFTHLNAEVGEFQKKLQEEKTDDLIKPYQDNKDKNRPSKKSSVMSHAPEKQEIFGFESMDERLFCNSSCARTRKFKGRKYDESYYINTNKRITEMEVNDDKLRTKMMAIMAKANSYEELINTSKNSVVCVQKLQRNSRVESLSSTMMDSSSSNFSDIAITTVSSENDNFSQKYRSVLSIPPVKVQCSNILPVVETVGQSYETIASHEQSDSENIISVGLGRKKHVKPIKIRKVNGFYKLLPRGSFTLLASGTYGSAKPAFTKNKLQTLNLENIQRNQENLPTIITAPGPVGLRYGTSVSISTNSSVNETVPLSSKPTTEIASQIKIVDVYSLSNTASNTNALFNKNPERGMLVLKPDEINKRLMENKFNEERNLKREEDVENAKLDQDTEKFFTTTSVFAPINSENFELLEDNEVESKRMPNSKPVWIECTNILHLGYLCGRKNSDNRICFKFPGFKYTDYYEEQEAFSKINQVFSRKVYMPMGVVPQWHTVESYHNLDQKNKLNSDELGSDFVLTKEGLRHKRLLLAGLKKRLEDPAPPSAQLRDMIVSHNLDSGRVSRRTRRRCQAEINIIYSSLQAIPWSKANKEKV